MCYLSSCLRCYSICSETSSLNEPALPEQVKKLNRQNTEHSHESSNAGSLRQDDRERQEPAELIQDGSETSAVQPEDRKKVTNQGEEGDKDGNIFENSESEEEKQDEKVEDDGKRKHNEKSSDSGTSSVTADICLASLLPQQRYLDL